MQLPFPPIGDNHYDDGEMLSILSHVPGIRPKYLVSEEKKYTWYPTQAAAAVFISVLPRLLPEDQLYCPNDNDDDNDNNDNDDDDDDDGST